MTISTLYSPFAFQPSDTQVKTGSFTIPTGKYAMVTNYTGLSVDTGSGVQNIGSSVTIAVNSSGAGTTTLHTATSKELWRAYVESSSSTGTANFFFEDLAAVSTITLSSNNSGTGGAGNNGPGTYIGMISLNNGDKLRSTITGDGTGSLILVSEGEQSPIWVDAGDILNGETYSLTIYDKTI